MLYYFKYFFERAEEEQEITIEATDEKEAVKKLFDKVGVCQFGCIKENGNFFTDDKYPTIKYKMAIGC